MIEFVHYTATDLERLEAWSRLKYNDEMKLETVNPQWKLIDGLHNKRLDMT